MQQENVESLRQAQDAINRRYKTAWLATSHPEGEMVPAQQWPESTTIHGAEAIWDFYMDVMAAWEEDSFEFGEMIDSGADKIVANVRRETRGKASGAGVEFSYWLVSTFRDGKTIRAEWFAQRADALEAAGLREQARSMENVDGARHAIARWLRGGATLGAIPIDLVAEGQVASSTTCLSTSALGRAIGPSRGEFIGATARL